MKWGIMRILQENETLSFKTVLTCRLLVAMVIAVAFPNEQVEAVWSNNPAINTPVSVARGYQFNTHSVSDGSGGVIMTWEDRRNGQNNVDIYAQRIDGSGIVLWSVDGVLVAETGRQYSFYSTKTKIVSDGGGGAIITWEDERAGTNDVAIYAQRIDASGSVKWTPDGVMISAAGSKAGKQYDPTLASDDRGGAIITWSTWDPDDIGKWNIYTQRVNSRGGVQWALNGIVILSAKYGQGNPDIVSDGRGGGIIAWGDRRNGISNFFAQRIDANGILQWTADGVPVSTTSDMLSGPFMISDGSGGAIITWSHLTGIYDIDIYAQRIDANGAMQWLSDGVPICSATGSIYPISIVSDISGGAIIAWNDFRDSSTLGSRIYVQRINGPGLIQWTANGIPVSASRIQQLFQSMVADGIGGAIVTWEDMRNEPASRPDIYAQRINASGALQWTNKGATISIASNQQILPQIVSDGRGGAIIAWEDDRNYDNSERDIYAQHVYADGTLSLPVPVPTINGWGVMLFMVLASTFSVYRLRRYNY